jgi:hypothetical protein
MAFGQPSGPPASARQTKDLLALLKDVGYNDFREARGEMGFTQRQAGGKFTNQEATAFIERLQDPESQTAVEAPADRVKIAAQEQLLRHLPAEQLATELRRRGWSVSEP